MPRPLRRAVRLRGGRRPSLPPSRLPAATAKETAASPDVATRFSTQM